MEENNKDGKGQAIASLVLGIVSIVCCSGGPFSIVSVATGIVGLVTASISGKKGYSGGLRTAGFVCSIIGLCLGGLTSISCLACVGTVGASTSGGLHDLVKLIELIKEFKSYFN